MRTIPILLFTATLAGFHAAAATFYVTDTNDTVRPNSLRGAILAANQNAQNHRGINNTIYLGGRSRRNNAPIVFRLTIAGAGEDAAQTGDLDITAGHLTIIGANANTTIDASSLGDRVFQIFPKANLILENLVITGGKAPGNSSGFANEAASGGAIYNAGNLTLSHCIIVNNASGGGQPQEGNFAGTRAGDGGGIYNIGSFSAIDSQIVGNSSGSGFDGNSGGNGGGIFNVGTGLLTECVISGNQGGRGGDPEGNDSGFGGGGGSGGAIYNAGKMILKDCAVQQNATGDGADGGDPSGDILAFSPPPGGPGGNGGDGGGIYNFGSLELDFSSVCENLCGSGGSGDSFFNGGNAGSGGGGGGIFNCGKLVLNTSTLSANSCGNGGDGGTGTGFGSGFAIPAFNIGGNGGKGGSGGGICNSPMPFPFADPTHPISLTLSSCTIAVNSPGSGGNGGNSVGNSTGASGGNGGNGGGVCDTVTNSTTRNSLIALNFESEGGNGGVNSNNTFSIITGLPVPGIPPFGDAGVDGTSPDVSGTFSSQGLNLIGIADGSTGFTNGIGADQIGSSSSPIDPLLGPLQMNGGLTPTQALLPGSPAINQGNSFGVKFDQRNQKRPFEYPAINDAPGGDGSDIGAFELGPSVSTQ